MASIRAGVSFDLPDILAHQFLSFGNGATAPKYRMDKVHQFGDGDYFGDVALSTKKSTRTARIVTTKDSHFACMSKADYV